MKPMLLKDFGLNPDHLKQAILNPNIFVEQKVDGQRVVTICDENGEVKFYNRKGDEILMKGGFVTYFSKYSNRVFDGEFVNGTYWLFDSLTSEGDSTPLHERLETLHELANSTKTVKLLPTAVTKEQKRDLIRAVIKSHGEGVVMKDRESVYLPGQRVNFKYKFYNDIDVVVSSLHEEKDSANIIVYDEQENPVEIGSIKAPLWVDIGDVLLVKYLYATEDRKLYQPSLLHRRMDKLPEECSVKQLRYTNRSVLDHEQILALT